MSIRIVRPKARIYSLISLAMLVVALSWSSPIDNFTEDYLNNSIKGAGIIFGIARAINAIISVTQSAEVSVGIASVSPGEILDPINDLIEQFSEVMIVSITSLAFQKVLIGIAAHWFFNALVTLTAFAYIITLRFLRQHNTAALKAFATMGIVRLFLSLVILANSAVDSIFLESQVQDGERNLRLLKTQVKSVSSDAMSQAEGAPNNAEFDQQILDIDRQIQLLDHQMSRLSGDISKLNEGKDAVTIDLPWWLPEFLSKDPQVQEANIRIEEIEIEIENDESELSEIESATAVLNDERACLLKQSHGESCSWLGIFSKYGNNIKNKASKIASTFDDYIDKVITLMALIVLRSILLPLFFWVLIYKSIKWIWEKSIPTRQV